MQINEELIEKIREANPIKAVVERKVEGFRAFQNDGRERIKCLCPLHDESTPSFKVYLETESWYCFGCEKGGDVFTLIQELEEVGFVEAANILAEDAGITVPGSMKHSIELEEERRKAQNILAAASGFYHGQLLGDSDYLNQLQAERCWTLETIKQAKLGLAKSNGLADYLDTEGFDLELAKKVGLIKQSNADFFSNRLIIPYMLRGSVVYMSGRALDENHTNKYQHLPASELIGKATYNADDLHTKKELFIVEGFADALTLKEWGYGVIALSGKSISKYECNAIKNHESIYIALDKDAQNKAIEVAKEITIQSKQIPCILTLPQGVKDPNDYAKQNHSKYEFKGLVDEAESVVDILIEEAKAAGETVQSYKIEELFRVIRNLSGFNMTYLKAKICGELNMKEKIFNAYMIAIRKQAASPEEEEYEVVDGYSLKVHPALDYQDDVGITCITMDMAGTNSGVIEKWNFLVTSDREMTKVNTDERFEIAGQQVLLTHDPKTWGITSRWNYKGTYNFTNGYDTKPYVLCGQVQRIFDKYIDFKDETISYVIALWTIGTYLFPLFEAYPYLHMYGIKGSGKTKAMNIIEKLAFNMIATSSMSVSSLFRLVNETRATLGIDEAENLYKMKGSEAQELVRLLNAGYKKGQLVYRTEKDSNGGFTPRGYECYSPKVLASINPLDNVLASRCIPILMLRTSNSDKGNLFVSSKGEDWAWMRNDMYTLALTNFKEIRDIYENDKSIRVLSNRDNELWLPLLSLAKFFDKNGVTGIFGRIQAYAKQSTNEDSGSSLSEVETVFLQALINLDANGMREVRTGDVSKQMQALLEEDKHYQVTSSKIGNWFKYFDLGKKKRKGKGMFYVLNSDAILDRCQRYGVNIEPIKEPIRKSSRFAEVVMQSMNTSVDSSRN